MYLIKKLTMNMKCDEGKPACKKCSQHGVTCSYTPAVVKSSHSSPSGASKANGYGISDPKDNSQDIMDAEIPVSSLSQDEDINLLELELLHNYCTSTCYTISRNPLLQNIYRLNIPRLGFSNSFIMRSILAISALHLAHCNPEKKDFYVHTATVLHEKALRTANKVLLNITQENCTSLYLLTALTCIIACAKSPNANDFFLLQNNGLSDWFKLFRGTLSIVKTYEDALHRGPLAALFKIGHRKTVLRENLSVAQQQPMIDLRQYISQTVTDLEALKAYSLAVDELSKAFNLTLNSNSSGSSTESSEIFVWLSNVPDEYMRLLSMRAPEALVILAYYCVLVKQLEWAWWMQGWSMHLIARIYNSLSHEYRGWIQWPIEQIGWVPMEEDYDNDPVTMHDRESVPFVLPFQ